MIKKIKKENEEKRDKKIITKLRIKIKIIK